MKGFTAKALFCITVLATLMMSRVSLLAKEPSLFFARSGQIIRIPEATQLRFLNAPITSHPQGKFKLPPLRVPGLIEACNSSGDKLVEFVVYPRKNVNAQATPRQQVAIKLLGAPLWFEQLAKATQFFTDDAKTPCLLILGPDTAGDSPQAALELMEQHSLKTLLVFSPHWSGPVRAKPTSFTIAQTKGFLLQDYQPLGDPTPLRFSYQQTPCPKIMNRLSWLGTVNELPYVEELWFDQKRRVIVSYVPWQETLGRHEQADRLFRYLLAKAAKNHELQNIQDFPHTTFQLQWPRQWDIHKTERPIIHHLLTQQARTFRKQDYHGPVLHVVDLRGKPVQRAKHSKLRKSLTHRPLLILGTDPILDAEQVKDGNVTWLKNDTLPLDAPNAYRLMETLTQLHIVM